MSTRRYGVILLKLIIAGYVVVRTADQEFTRQVIAAGLFAVFYPPS